MRGKSVIIAGILLSGCGILGLGEDTVRVLVEGQLPAGRHTVVWDQRDDNGKRVSTGKYKVAMDAGPFSQSQSFKIAKGAPLWEPSEEEIKEEGTSSIPAMYSLYLPQTKWAPGDTVVIYCALPQASETKIVIKED